ncbi:MAG: HEAT repeat domain-containing protein [Planctomycetota bacterium]
MKGLRFFFFGVICILYSGCSDSPEVVEDQHRLEVFIQMDQLMKDWDRLQFRGEYFQERELRQKIRTMIEREYFWIIEGLTGENSDYRAISAQSLGFSDNPHCLGALVSVLNDPVPQVSINAGNALIRLGYSEVPLTPLENMLHSPHRQVQLVALRMLGRLKNSKGISLIVPYFQDPNLELAIQAVRSMGQIHVEAAIDALLQHALFSPRPEIREEAARMLGENPSKKSVAPLIEMLKDPQLAVQQMAWFSLQKITTRFLPLQYEAWKSWLADDPSMKK